MSTNIQIDVVLQRLQEQARQVLGFNRADRQERDEQSQSAQSSSRTRSRTEQRFVLIAQGRTGESASEQDGQGSTEERSAVPDLYKQRRPAAQRGGGWGVLYYDWVPQVLVGSTGIPSPSGGVFQYTYILAKDFRILLSTQRSPVVDPYAAVQNLPQAAFALTTNGGALGNSSNHNNLPVLSGAGTFAGEPSFGGSVYYTQPPVLASNGAALYGMFRHTIYKLNTPWTQVVSNGFAPVSSTGTTITFTYISFKYNTVSGKLDTRSSTATYLLPPYTLFDVTPYVEGGAIWAEKYAANAFPGDPSLQVRQLGYYGDYHVKGSKAQFLRRGSPSSGIYTSLTNRTNRSLFGRAEDLYWLTFDVNGNGSPSALKAELELCQPNPSIPVKPFTAKPAFNREADKTKFNDLTNAVLEDITVEEFMATGGPYAYPLLPPP